jgi:S-adenosylmethionine:diacylglycerol 3-amino-3-carboxypropyl transferase
LARLLHPRLVDDLFAIDDLEAQRVFVAQRWDRAAWRRTFEFALSLAVSRIFYGDPAWYAHAQVAPGPFIFERFTEGLGRCLARDSFMASLTLRGRLTPGDLSPGDLSPGNLPPHLTPEGVAAIVPRLGSVTSVVADLGHYLDSGAGRFDRFSLSDVASYMPEAGFHALARAAVGAARPGARVVMRQFLTRYPLPAEVAPTLRREPALEAELALLDRALAYTFIIGEVVHDAAG